jgi:hypothetical protein
VSTPRLQRDVDLASLDDIIDARLLDLANADRSERRDVVKPLGAEAFPIDGVELDSADIGD